ncbi:MAG: serine/threonine protein kinase [Myxococcales bacterium]|nr:serine/threonine protein kinase [Myxococcales bacterium]
MSEDPRETDQSPPPSLEVALPDEDDADDAWIDRIVDGRYRVLERVGRGGMGVVYRVEHTRMGKIAAMKLLHASLVADRALIRRFQAEAEAISKLTHPNIVQVFDFGRADNTVFLVMEYLRGEDLATILRRDGPLPLRRCASIVLQVCDALAEAHGFGIIHRDLKPENIRVSRTKDGQDFVKVLDFGLAKMVEGDHQAAITAQNNLVGTPYYMAPEQIRGEDLDARVDVYSLGAMLYRMLTSHHAYTAKSPMGVLTKHLTEPLIPPSERCPDLGFTEEVDELVARAMDKKRETRFQDVLELKRELINLASSTSQDGEVMRLSPRDSGTSYDSLPRNRRESDTHGSATPASGSTSKRIRSDVSQRTDSELAFMPTGPIDVDEITSGERLQRADFDFERKLRRGRLFKLLLLLPLLGGGAFAAYWYGFRKPPQIAPSEEVEPNNDVAHSTLLESGKTVRGKVGKRVSSNESDRDYYKLVVPRDASGKTMVLAADVSGIPNMDITLELYDRAGDKLTGADNTGPGGPERLPNWPLQPGTYYLLVREVWKMGRPPTENVTDSYRLTAKLAPHDKRFELEPNDEKPQAEQRAVGDTVRGYIGKIGDADFFKVSGEGRLSATVQAKGAQLSLEVVDLHGASRRKKSEARGALAKLSGITLAKNKPVFVVVRSTTKKKPIAGLEPPELAAPYTLKLFTE